MSAQSPLLHMHLEVLLCVYFVYHGWWRSSGLDRTTTTWFNASSYPGVLLACMPTGHGHTWALLLCRKCRSCRAERCEPSGREEGTQPSQRAAWPGGCSSTGKRFKTSTRAEVCQR